MIHPRPSNALESVQSRRILRSQRGEVNVLKAGRERMAQPTQRRDRADGPRRNVRLLGGTANSGEEQRRRLRLAGEQSHHPSRQLLGSMFSSIRPIEEHERVAEEIEKIPER